MFHASARVGDPALPWRVSRPQSAQEQQPTHVMHAMFFAFRIMLVSSHAVLGLLFALSVRVLLPCRRPSPVRRRASRSLRTSQFLRPSASDAW